MKTLSLLTAMSIVHSPAIFSPHLLSLEHQFDCCFPPITSHSELSTRRFVEHPIQLNRRHSPNTRMYCHLFIGPGTSPLPWAYIPVIFKMTGKFSSDECYLTSAGDVEGDGVDSAGETLASCWIQTSGGTNDTIEWDVMHTRLFDLVI